MCGVFLYRVHFVLCLYPIDNMTILVKDLLRLRRNGRHFADDIVKCMFLNENFKIVNKILLIYVL